MSESAGDSSGYVLFSSPAATAQADAQLTRYELRRLLGRGGFGTVHEAWDCQLQRTVALKRLNLHGEHSQAWLREARLASRVRHRAFVTIHDVFVDQGCGCIVMELVRGRNLAQLMDEDAIPSRQAIDWVRQASEALAEAHRQQVVHGDIKPANLMVEDGATTEHGSAEGRLRILDFGVAGALDRLLTIGPGGSAPLATTTAGTLAYMAPEQMLGAAPSVASDIYALGLVLHQLLTGQGSSSVAARDSLALAHAKLYAAELVLPAVPGVPAELMALLQRMISRQPERRPGSMEEVSEVLAAVLAGWGASPSFSVSAVIDPKASLHLLSALRPQSGWRIARSAWMALLLVLGLAMAVSLGALRLPGQPLHWRDRLQQAEQLYAAFDEEDDALQRSIALLEGVITEKPRHAPALARLALANVLWYTTDGKDESVLQRAATSAQLAVQAESQLALAHAAAGAVMRLQGRLDEAEQAYQRALALDGACLPALQGEAKLWAARKRPQEAQAAFERALQKHPDNVLLLNQLGSLFFELGELSQAERLFRRAVVTHPRSTLGYRQLSAVLVRQNRIDEAQTVLQQGLSLHPSWQLYTNLGNLQFGRGRYVEAADAFERAVSGAGARPNDYLMWANLADSLLLLPGRGAEAQRAYRHALDQLQPLIQAKPDDATQLSRAGLYAARLGEAAQALAWSQQALALTPDQPDALFRGALAAELSGQRGLALARLQRARAKGYPMHLIEQEPALADLRRDRRYHQPVSEE